MRLDLSGFRPAERRRVDPCGYLPHKGSERSRPPAERGPTRHDQRTAGRGPLVSTCASWRPPDIDPAIRKKKNTPQRLRFSQPAVRGADVSSRECLSGNLRAPRLPSAKARHKGRPRARSSDPPRCAPRDRGNQYERWQPARKPWPLDPSVPRVDCAVPVNPTHFIKSLFFKRDRSLLCTQTLESPTIETGLRMKFGVAGRKTTSREGRQEDGPR